MKDQFADGRCLPRLKAIYCGLDEVERHHGNSDPWPQEPGVEVWVSAKDMELCLEWCGSSPPFYALDPLRFIGHVFPSGSARQLLWSGSNWRQLDTRDLLVADLRLLCCAISSARLRSALFQQFGIVIAPVAAAEDIGE